MKKKIDGHSLCRSAMCRLADRYKTRDMSQIAQIDWNDYAAIRILEALMTLCSMVGEGQTKFPVVYGFRNTQR